jgi:hypothetical protein
MKLTRHIRIWARRAFWGAAPLLLIICAVSYSNPHHRVIGGYGVGFADGGFIVSRPGAVGRMEGDRLTWTPTKTCFHAPWGGRWSWLQLFPAPVEMRGQGEAGSYYDGEVYFPAWLLVYLAARLCMQRRRPTADPRWPAYSKAELRKGRVRIVSDLSLAVAIMALVGSLTAPIGKTLGESLVLPAGAGFIVFAGSLVVGACVWLTSHRLKVGHCECCGYDLTGNVSGVCPECGTPVPQTNSEETPTK